jgi:hypothetical protein
MARSVSENPVVGPRASGFVAGKDGEAGDIAVYRRYSRTQSSRKISRSKPDRILRQAPRSALGPGRMSRNLNLYPWLVAAFQQESRATVLAVARPFKSVLTGDSIRFDSAALAFQSNILSHAWEFHDGTRVQGPNAEKVYTDPGCYMASLWITDDQGHRDVDFCRVRVYSRSDPEAFIPTLFVTHAPSRHVRVDQAVHFRIWPQGRDVKPINVDFGDGRLVKDYTPYSAITHRFKRPGIHVVTVTGRAGELPVTQKVKVVIDQ